MVRMHAMNILDDAGVDDSGKEGDLQASMELVGKGAALLCLFTNRGLTILRTW